MAKLQTIDRLDKWQPSFQDIKHHFDVNMNPRTMDLNDQDVYEDVYGKGQWAGIFQCIAEGTVIEMLTGKKKIEDVDVDDWIISRDEHTTRLTADIVQDVQSDKRSCIELSFDDGTTLVCTPDHWIKTVNRGWVEADGLTVDDEIMQGGLIDGIDAEVHLSAAAS